MKIPIITDERMPKDVVVMIDVDFVKRVTGMTDEEIRERLIEEARKRSETTVRSMKTKEEF